jgi:outer membrane biosynthesis protein TonB
MTVNEAKEAIAELKAQGNTEEEIAGSFYLMFCDGKIDVNQFDALVNLLGYHLTDEFLAMSEEEQKTQGFEKEDEAAEGVTDKEVDEAKDNETNPVKPEGEEHGEKPEESEESEEEPKEEPKEDEEDEEKKAMKLFGK